MHRPLPLLAYLLAVLVLTLPAPSAAATPSVWTFSRSAPTEALMLFLTTRPGVTDPAAALALAPAARAGARAFEAVLRPPTRSWRDTLGWHRFAGLLGVSLAKLSAAYQGAAPGADGAATRGAAFTRFFAELPVAAARAGLPPERLDLALLSAAAAFEAELAAPPAVTALSLPERELVELLLLNSVKVIRSQTLLDATVLSSEYLGIDGNSLVRGNRIVSLLKNYLNVVLVALEEELSDPLILADAQSLRMRRYNTEANFDLLLMKLGMELYFFGAVSSKELDGLAARMDSVGGVMSGMTLERLVASGLFVAPMYPYTTGQFPHFQIFNALDPQQELAYQPLPGLADQLRALGGQVPDPPNFSMFADPYLALAELEYDLRLCREIYWQEWHAAGDLAGGENRPMSLQEYFAPRAELLQRITLVMARLSGASDQQKQAYATLLNLVYM